MRILIYGAGVIGSLYAVLFAETGYDTSIYARGKRLEFLKKNGLLYKKNQNIRRAKATILGELSDNDAYDFILLTVRENQLYEALTELKNNKSNIIVTMVNSLDSYKKWEDIVGKGRILPAFPGAGGSINNDGILDAALTPRMIQPTTFAEISGNKSEKTKQFSKILRHAHIPYQKVVDMHMWQLCHLAMVVPIADAYYEADCPERAGRDWKTMKKTARRLKRNFTFLRKQKGKLSPWKMNIFRFVSLPFLTIMLAVTFGSSFGDKFMYQHAMKAPDEMRELHKQFYAYMTYMKRMKKCGCKAKKVQ
ncbi:ketopantoate reductase family protein [Faecalicatena fissicatena]|uniref:Ketopantoate reductase family protein n=1 Tax=Faecalicatena fissicatena TaxID=290055 RepID=A0ABX2GYR3_9FIRM|nr:ketopantoate reductase family protein [Faecalicatena fissicatena]MCB5867679.1 ketopantoate reductase family protein [Faecalicatena fissicatena]NSD82691.1 ketopantoate reductase family protein [Faecalicatena fissicatena]NSE55255.1 ketopantoate reductase family protein [Faecalicatena fissicatena]NSE64002.1 ketopantoate reductase family protein [Faecalicatena fissicatena]NSG30129.1 ketopantoate reductase family protein [Faecalicatena fissicatena]